MPDAPIEEAARGAADWLPTVEGRWVRDHPEVLAEIARAFIEAGEWPDPVQLDRQLRSEGRRLDIVKTASSLPNYLGRYEQHQSRVVLTILGLACVPEASELVGQYFAVLGLALEVFDDPSREAKLTDGEVQARLALDENDMTILSQLLLDAGNPFAAGAQASEGHWTIQIDHRATEFDPAKNADEFITLLAEMRVPRVVEAIPEDSIAEPEELSTNDATPESRISVGRAAGIGGGILGVVLAVALAPPALVAGSVVFLIAVVLLRDSLFGAGATWPIWLAVIVLVMAVAGAVALIQDREPSIEKQLGADLSTVAGFRVVSVNAMKLRGSKAGDTLVALLRDKNQSDKPKGDLPVTPNGDIFTPKSDELRVYNVDGGRVRFEYQFLPQSLGQVRQLPEGDFPYFKFRPVQQTDLDGNRQNELVGMFERGTLATGPQPVPVVLAWDPHSKKYSLSPLIPKPPELKGFSENAHNEARGFRHPTVIDDRLSSTVLKGYGADAYRIFQRSPSPVLMALYMDPATMGGDLRAEVAAWTLDIQNGNVEAFPCGPSELGSNAVLVSVGTKNPDQVLSEELLPRFSPPCGKL